MNLQTRGHQIESTAHCRLAQRRIVAILAAAAVGLFSGCSTIRRSRLMECRAADSNSITRTNGAVTAASSQIRSAELQYLKYHFDRGDDDPVLPSLLESPPRFHWTGSDINSRDQPSATGVARNESLFSKDYWELVGYDVKEVFTAPARWETKDWLVAGGVAAGIGLTMVFDQDIRNTVQRNRNHTTDDIFKAVEPFGQEYSIAALGGFYVGGEIFKDPRAKSVALDGLAASIIASGLIDQPLKYTVGRSRPNKERGAYDFRPFSGNDSFPSGHTTQAFAVATVVSEHYESLWVRITSYGLASAVGYARMNSDAHWASDVLAGAAIGTLVGEVVVRFNKGHRHLALVPLIGPHTKGAELVWLF